MASPGRWQARLCRRAGVARRRMLHVFKPAGRFREGPAAGTASATSGSEAAPCVPRAGPGSETAPGAPAAGGGELPRVGGRRVQPHAGQAGRGPAQAGRPDCAAAERGGRVRGRPAGARPAACLPAPAPPGAARAAGAAGPAGALLAGQKAELTIHAYVTAPEASAEERHALNGTVRAGGETHCWVSRTLETDRRSGATRCARCPASATRSRRS